MYVSTSAQPRDAINNLGVYVQQQGTSCGFTGHDAWVVLSPIEQSIKRKIESVGKPLRDWDISINYGIKTGYNDAFIITTERRDEILSNCKSEEERQRTEAIIRPILRGRDIKRYSYDWAGLWLIWIPWHFPLHLDPSIQGASAEAEQAFMNQYPSVYQHLLLYKPQLSARNKAETGIRYEWYALQRWGANYSEDFFQHKILYPDIMRLPRTIEKLSQYPYFALDKDGFIPEATLFMMTGENIEQICAFLCSEVGFFAFTRFYMGPILDDTGFRYKKEYLLSMPVPDVNILNNKEYENALTEALKLTLEELQFIDSYKKSLLGGSD